MALPLKRTLGDLRADIQVRLGFGMAGQAGVVNAPLIDSILRSGQNQLYEQFDWAELRGVELRTTGVGQQFYDYPADCSIEHIQKIICTWGGQLYELTEGIDTRDRSFPNASQPEKYERRDQIEIWPVPQSVYPLRIEYLKTLGPFTATNDRCTLPSEIVYLHALANAKKHYRQSDAQDYMDQLGALLVKLKQKHRPRTVYTANLQARSIYDYTPDSSQAT